MERFGEKRGMLERVLHKYEYEEEEDGRRSATGSD